MVAPGDVAWGPLELSKCKTVGEGDYELMMDHVTVKLRDIVLSRNQSFGIASYVSTADRFVLGQDMVLIQEGLATTTYLYLALRSQFVQRQIASLAMGSTFKRINLGDIRKLKIPVPMPAVEDAASSLMAAFEVSGRLLEEKIDSATGLYSNLLNHGLNKHEGGVCVY